MRLSIRFYVLVFSAVFTHAAFAGAFLFAKGNNTNTVAHPSGYTGNAGHLIITVGIAPDSDNAEDMEMSIRNVITTMNAFTPKTGNLDFDSNIAEFRQIDFESVALHEIGHCLGLAHPNFSGGEVSDSSLTNYTNSKPGDNNTLEFGPGVDGIIGSADDERGDDESIVYFNVANNNPFVMPDIVDSTSYSLNLDDLPAGQNFAANADRDVGEALGAPNSEAVMQQTTFNNEAQRDLGHDDVATLRYAMAGVDRLQGTNDDYTFSLEYAGLTSQADIVVQFDNSQTGFANCRVSAVSVAPNHFVISNADVNFNTTINWFFNDQEKPSEQNEDTTAPVVNAPDNIVVAAVDASGTPATNSAISSFIELATATDNIDAQLTITNNAPELFPLGVTTVTFSAEDAAGNIGQAQASVTVEDQTAPALTLLGESIIELTVGTDFVDPGATAIDNVDGDISANIVITGTVNTQVPGSNELQYSISDEAGNAAPEITRTINLVAPQIDTDGDGIIDDEDNCPATANNDQLDTDSDSLGNVCDADDDNDGIPDDFETENGLNPLNAADALLDNDGDGLTNFEEFLLGQNPNTADTNGNGIVDGEERFLVRILATDDVTGDGIGDLAEFYIQGNNPTARLLDATDFSVVKTLVWDVNYTVSSARIFTLHDFNNDGTDDFYLFGERQDLGQEGRLQVVVMDALSGLPLRTYNWPANWQLVTPLLLQDLTGDGIAEVAIQGTNVNNDRWQLIVRNGANNAAVDTFSYPELFSNPEYLQLSDVTGDGINEVGLQGNRTNTGKMQVRVADATNATNRLRSYNFANNWNDTQFLPLSDTDGEGTNDWGMFGIRKDDGRPQLLNKKGHDPRGILRIHAWPGDMQAPTFFRIPDLNNDSIDDVAVGGLRSTNRYQLIVRDGVDRARTLGNYGWPNNWNEVSFEVIPDITGDGLVEIALFGRSLSGEWELVVRDGETRAEIRRYNVGNYWSGKPQLLFMDDLNNDGIRDFLVVGDILGETEKEVYSGAEEVQL